MIVPCKHEQLNVKPDHNVIAILIVLVRLKQELLESTIELYNCFEALDGKDKFNGLCEESRTMS